MVSYSAADKETITGQPSQLSDRQTILQPDSSTHEPDLSPSSHTVPQIRNPPQTNSEDFVIDIKSFSEPNVNPHSLHSKLYNVEQEFIPLIDANGDLHGVQVSHVEDALNDKNADLKEAVANSVDHIVAKDYKVKSERVVDGETKERDEELMTLNNDGDKGIEDDKEGDDEDIETGDDNGNDKDVVFNKVDNNAKVDSRNDDATVTVHGHQVGDDNAKRKGGTADDLSQPVASFRDSTVHDVTRPTASVREISSSAVNDDFSSESSSSHLTDDQHSHPVIQEPAVSSSHQKFEQETSSQSDMNVRQLHGSGVDRLPYSGHFDKDFGQHQADFNQRGYRHSDNQPSDVQFPARFNRHLHRSSNPVWKHVHSSPVEEFRAYWPDMQGAYMSWPELMQERQRYMQHLRNYDNFMHRQQQFVNHQHWSHVRPEDGHYFQNQRTQFNRQDPHLITNQLPDEGDEGYLHFGDMFNNQQRYDHNQYNQEADVHRANIHIDQVYRQRPVDDRYRSGSDKDPDTGPVDKRVYSVGSSEQSGGQSELLTVDQIQRSSADKSQSDQSDVDHHITQWPNKDTAVIEDLTEVKKASSSEYSGDANVLSSSQEYADEASQPLSPLTDRKSEPISGEYLLRKLCIFAVWLTKLFCFLLQFGE